MNVVSKYTDSMLLPGHSQGMFLLFSRHPETSPVLFSAPTVLPAAPPSGVRRSKRTAGRSARADSVTSMQEKTAVLSFNHMITPKLCVPLNPVERVPRVGHWVCHSARRVLTTPFTCRGGW